MIILHNLIYLILYKYCIHFYLFFLFKKKIYSTGILPTITVPDETITNLPNNGGGAKPDKPASFTTFITTFTSVIPGTTKFITTTNEKGEPTTFSTYIPPSTVVIVKKITSPLPPEPTDIDNNSTIVLEENHAIWSIALSFLVGIISFSFFIIA